MSSSPSSPSISPSISPSTSSSSVDIDRSPIIPMDDLLEYWRSFRKVDTSLKKTTTPVQKVQQPSSKKAIISDINIPTQEVQKVQQPSIRFNRLTDRDTDEIELGWPEETRKKISAILTSQYSGVIDEQTQQILNELTRETDEKPKIIFDDKILRKLDIKEPEIYNFLKMNKALNEHHTISWISGELDFTPTDIASYYNSEQKIELEDLKLYYELNMIITIYKHLRDEFSFSLDDIALLYIATKKNRTTAHELIHELIKKQLRDIIHDPNIKWSIDENNMIREMEYNKIKDQVKEKFGKDIETQILYIKTLLNRLVNLESESSKLTTIEEMIKQTEYVFGFNKQEMKNILLKFEYEQSDIDIFLRINTYLQIKIYDSLLQILKFKKSDLKSYYTILGKVEEYNKNEIKKKLQEDSESEIYSSDEDDEDDNDKTIVFNKKNNSPIKI